MDNHTAEATREEMPFDFFLLSPRYMEKHGKNPTLLKRRAIIVKYLTAGRYMLERKSIQMIMEEIQEADIRASRETIVKDADFFRLAYQYLAGNRDDRRQIERYLGNKKWEVSALQCLIDDGITRWADVLERAGMLQPADGTESQVVTPQEEPAGPTGAAEIEGAVLAEETVEELPKAEGPGAFEDVTVDPEPISPQIGERLEAPDDYLLAEMGVISPLTTDVSPLEDGSPVVEPEEVLPAVQPFSITDHLDAIQERFSEMQQQIISLTRQDQDAKTQMEDLLRRNLLLNQAVTGKDATIRRSNERIMELERELSRTQESLRSSQMHVTTLRSRVAELERDDTRGTLEMIAQLLRKHDVEETVTPVSPDPASFQSLGETGLPLHSSFYKGPITYHPEFLQAFNCLGNKQHQMIILEKIQMIADRGKDEVPFEIKQLGGSTTVSPSGSILAKAARRLRFTFQTKSGQLRFLELFDRKSLEQIAHF